MAKWKKSDKEIADMTEAVANHNAMLNARLQKVKSKAEAGRELEEAWGKNKTVLEKACASERLVAYDRMYRDGAITKSQRDQFISDELAIARDNIKEAVNETEMPISIPRIRDVTGIPSIHDVICIYNPHSRHCRGDICLDYETCWRVKEVREYRERNPEPDPSFAELNLRIHEQTNKSAQKKPSIASPIEKERTEGNKEPEKMKEESKIMKRIRRLKL